MADKAYIAGMPSAAWTLAIDGADPVPCEFETHNVGGLKHIRFVVPFDRYERVGDDVSIVLAGGGREAKGTGFIESVSVSGDEAKAVIIGIGPLETLPGEAVRRG